LLQEGRHTLFLKNDNTVWATGYDGSGAMEVDGTLTTRTTAFQIPGLTGITAISAGDFSIRVFLKNDNTVWSVGDDGSGQLGVGSVVDKTTPVQVQGSCSGTISNNRCGRIVISLSIYPNPREDELTYKKWLILHQLPLAYTLFRDKLLYESEFRPNENDTFHPNITKWTLPAVQ